MNSLSFLRQMLQDMRYAVQGTPCEAVLGQRFRVYPDRLHELFPDDTDAEFEGIVSYAGYPLLGQDGTPLGTVAVAVQRIGDAGERDRNDAGGQ